MVLKKTRDEQCSTRVINKSTPKTHLQNKCNIILNTNLIKWFIIKYIQIGCFSKQIEIKNWNLK
jgi:hypothetical protein